MILGLRIGDAYGAGLEYVDKAMVRNHNNLSGYVKHLHHRIKPGCYTDDTQISTLLKNCISFCGDVDTVAAIAMAAGSCCREMVQDIPMILILKLKKRKFGKDYLMNLDKQLMNMTGK